MAATSTFANFQLDAVPVGVGQSASVFRARDTQTDQVVALKVFNADVFGDPVLLKRFEREVTILFTLSHPSIIRSYANGVCDGRPWISMDLCEGRSLKDHEYTPEFSIGRKLRGLARVASALDHTHAAGVIHRDLKPSNILVHTTGDFVLSDFGVAKLLNEASKLTCTGSVLGTVAYMSPEQAQDKALTPASDIYSLGVIAYQCLFGTLPFIGGSAPAVMLKHVTEPLPIPPNTNPLIASILRRALAKDPAQRWRSATDFIAMLNEALLDAFQSSQAEVDVTRMVPAVAEQMRLLIADESADVRAMLARYFNRSNVSMTVTHTGAETLQKTLYGSFDVILLQLGMGTVSGLDLCKRVRDVEKRYGKRALIVCMADRDDIATKNAASAAGADLVVARPPDASVLDPIIKMFSGGGKRHPA